MAKTLHVVSINEIQSVVNHSSNAFKILSDDADDESLEACPTPFPYEADRREYSMCIISFIFSILKMCIILICVATDSDYEADGESLADEADPFVGCKRKERK